MRRNSFALLLLASLGCGGLAAEKPSEAQDPHWLAHAQQAIAEREYAATHNDAGLQAPNRAHNLRTYFGPAGIRVHDRTAPGSPELLALSLSGVGRGEFAPVPAGEVASDGARVEIRRPGLVEWYENSAAGLEQGFTLAQRPAGDGPIVVELAAQGARVSLADDRVLFATASGRRLAYGSLLVRDAGGQEIPARFEVAASDRVRIAVDDADAAYPLVIDPLLTETADAQVDANQDHANLGNFVANAGDVNGDGYGDVIVGAPFYDDGENDEGAAFVFHGGPAGITSGGPLAASAKITANQALANLSAVSGAGDVNGDGYDDVITGAVGYNAGQGFQEGIALVFLGGPTGVGDGTPANADAVLESNQGGAWFGVRVAGAGDVNGDGYADVIVGAHVYDDGQSDEGAAFVFLGSATGVANGNPATANAKFTSDQSGAQLGLSAAGAGDVNGDGYADVIVGAPLYDAGQTDEGEVFVFLGGPSGTGNGSPANADAHFESNQIGARFGMRAAGAGDVNGDGYSDVIVGAPLYDAGQSDEGAAFVFLGSSSGIVGDNPANAAATLQSDQASAQLGDSVASAGDVNGDGYADVLVGAPFYDAGESDEGAAFLFFGSTGGIANGTPATAAAQLEANQADARLGQESVSSAGDVNGDGYADVIVGALGYDAGNTNEGAAFVYLGGGQGISGGGPGTAAAQLEANQGTAKFGWSVASAGDVNGDSFSDVIVGAPTYDAGQSDEGAAFIFYGGTAGIADGDPTTAPTQLESDQPGASLGWSVASAGDVNGDGYGDVIVGAYTYTNGEVAEGAAFVFHGSATGVADGNPTTAATRLQANQVSAQLGFSVASAGDVNGDGFGDVIVGAPLYDAGESNEGAAFVFHGSTTGVKDANPTTAATTIQSDQADALLGVSVASAGDVNRDGYADVIVGARDYDAPEADEGAAFLYLGDPGGIANGNPATAKRQVESNQAGAHFGISVAAAGDVNGDGYADVIVGAYRYATSFNSEGAAFVYHGNASSISSVEDFRLNGGIASALFGSSVATAGDVNGDGYADVIVGANNYNGVGAAFVVTGTAYGVGEGVTTQLDADASTGDFGFSVASAGDVNGDGYADVIVGAQAADLGTTDEGAAFVYLGNGDGDGRPVRMRQLLADASGEAPVQPWGATGGQFRVRMNVTHPAGRGRAKLEVEACDPNHTFGDASCIHHTGALWFDVTTSSGGVIVTEVVPGLSADTLYRWRARVLFAPLSIVQPGITAPAKPAHGPWRRLQAQAFGGDLRSLLDTDGDGFANISDADDDDDGLTDVAEGVAGTNPLDPDSDDDGLSDGTEVLFTITNPLDPDHDNDGYCDGPGTGGGTCTAGDNCPAVANAGQQNADALPAGNACQCGDVTGEGIVNATDLLRAREYVVDRTASGPFDVSRCDVAPGDVCDLADLAALQRYVTATPGAGIANVCDAFVGP